MKTFAVVTVIQRSSRQISTVKKSLTVQNEDLRDIRREIFSYQGLLDNCFMQVAGANV
jgi:hypothetical protein